MNEHSPIERLFNAIGAGLVRCRDSVLNAFDRGRQDRIEAELDRTQDEVRHTILRLADALGMEAHEARKALIRESFIASGKAPEEH